MNKNLIIFISFIGLIGLLSGCEKDETKVTLSDNPIVPTLGTMPNLTLERTNGTDTLVFTGTPVDPGFQASANYFLEACAHGNNFKDSVVILTDIQDTAMKITVSDLNGILIKDFPADQASTLDFRIRSVLVADAGTGVKPLVYSSETKSVDVTIYGLPRLDLLNSGVDQKIQSALGNGVYTGYVKLDATKAFTLKDPDSGTEYGGSGGTLAVNGAAISASSNGWYKLDANVNALTYNLSPYNVGVVGEFTGWGGSSDYFMDYDLQKGYWYITIDLPVGPMKFRLNSDWTYNWGPGADTDLPANGGTLALPNTNGNINITAAGNYTIHLTITGSTSGTVTFIKN
jgi:starch-binding outer membrane protein SusE/F